ncbi:hypothetical protein [Algisphaera agarilytica]|uniref:Uncharacterized protein n=1 Tax=Algisphaera agarilytica TaxID=1385975 RepID=A0A7X0H415_9BACT|nr:hypothetical protein [Algisphaera agarilytica]MBB6428876.1 hypothetical protein [Algisphaera agarilytica]
MSQASAGFPWFIVWVVIIGFLPGLLLLIAGRRGKRIDDHPICRGCGFDLVGTHEPIPDKHPKCPECGTRREPLVGNRKRRPVLVLAGVLLMLASLGGAGVWGYQNYGAEQLAKYKPVWLLRWEARSGSSSAAGVALSEMTVRLKNGQLSNTALERLMDDAVAYGPAGNPLLTNVAIGNAWDDLAVELLRRGVGTPAEHEIIGRSWIEFSVEVRAKTHVGESVPIRFKRREFGPSYAAGLYGHLDPPVIVMDTQRYPLGMSSGGSLSATRGGGSSSSGWSGTSLAPSYGLPRGLGLGVHEMVAEVPVRITDGQNGPLLVHWTEPHPVRFEYVPEGGDPIAMIHDPALAAQVEQAVELRDGELTVNTYGINAMLDWSSIPVDLAYQLYMQRGEQKWKLSTVASTQTVGNHGFGIGGAVPDEWEDGTLVDLVFEPAPDVASDTPDITAILDHAFVIRGVKIVRPTNP